MFSGMKIRTKIISAFIAITVLTTLLGLFALTQIGRVNEKSNDMSENLLPSVLNLGIIDSQLNLNRRGEI